MNDWLLGFDPRVAEWLRDMGIDARGVRRVVIDIKLEDIVTVYVERFGTEKMLDVETRIMFPSVRVIDLGAEQSGDADEPDDPVSD